jgi:thiol-disulfide isomerase/thioredoxin
MGKAERIRQQTARERIAAQQAAARRAESRKRMLLASLSVLAVIVIVVVLVVVRNVSDNNKTAAAATAASAAQSQSVTQQITSVPSSTLDSVGQGSASKLIPTSGQPPLTSGGKPEILYVGAEYCPYCAAERWAMVVALSRFGTFSNLHYTHSSSTDVYPSTPTLTFYKSSYSSKYIDFQPVEWYSNKAVANGYSVLQAPTKSQSATFDKYDAAPYVQSSDAGSFPFVDIGNQYLAIGAQYIPSNLAKLSWSQVATDIRNPGSTVAKDIDGAANSITAAICKITKDAPAAVCSSAAAQAGAGSL